MEWYYTKDQKQNGPISQSDLIHKISTGEVSSNDFAWRDGMGDWLPISNCPELQITSTPASSGPPSVPQGSSTPQASSTVPDSPQAPPVHHTAAPQRKTSGLAIASLCLGIGSIVICGLLAIPTVICGHMALGQIKRSKDEIEGKVMAVIGLIIGYLYILVILVLILVFVVALGAGISGASMDSPSDDDPMWDTPTEMIEWHDGDLLEGSEPRANDLVPE